MVLKEVVDKLKKKEGIEVEFFKLVIVLFFDIYGFFFFVNNFIVFGNCLVFECFLWCY